MNLNQIHSIIKDFRDEPDNNLPADTALIKVVFAMMKNQEWLLPIQKTALSLYLNRQAENAVADRFDYTNKYDK